MIHYNIKMGKYIARGIHCDVTISNVLDIICSYYDFTKHIDVAIRGLFYYILLRQSMILLLSL